MLYHACQIIFACDIGFVRFLNLLYEYLPVPGSTIVVLL